MSKHEVITHPLPFPHPTPAHIRSCIFDELSADLDGQSKDPIPYRVYALIKAGISKACAEHDRGEL